MAIVNLKYLNFNVNSNPKFIEIHRICGKKSLLIELFTFFPETLYCA